MRARQADETCPSVDRDGTPDGDLAELLKDMPVVARIVALENAAMGSRTDGAPTTGNGSGRAEPEAEEEESTGR